MANKNTTSKTSSSSSTNSSYGSNTSTQGGSTSATSQSGGSHSTTNSHTEGGSHSVTQGYSDSVSSSVGGAQSTTAGKTYASGQIAEKTQAGFDKSTQEYVQSEAVQNAYSALQSAASNKPAFQSTYADKLANLYDSLMNRDKFSYNFNEDSMYQMYKDQYTQAGRNAMQDTMGQAAALSGGYNSSYAQSAGQQTYQNYLQELNNIIPQLRQQAYEEYQAEGQEMLNKYNLTNNAYNQEYAQYRDAVGDWQNDRSFNQAAYSDERNFDYNKYAGDRSFWQNEYWQEKNSEQSNLSQSNQSNWSNSQSHTNSYSETDTRSWSDTNSETNSTNWSNSLTNASNWSNQNTSGWQNSNTSSSSTTNSIGAGSGSGSGSGSSAYDSGNFNRKSWTTSATGDAYLGNLTQALYDVYQNEGQSGVDAALKDLSNNGFMTPGTKYSFSKDNINEIESAFRKYMDEVEKEKKK